MNFIRQIARALLLIPCTVILALCFFGEGVDNLFRSEAYRDKLKLEDE